MDGSKLPRPKRQREQVTLPQMVIACGVLASACCTGAMVAAVVLAVVR
jgi:hypothetical protein